MYQACMRNKCFCSDLVWFCRIKDRLRAKFRALNPERYVVLVGMYHLYDREVIEEFQRIRPLILIQRQRKRGQDAFFPWLIEAYRSIRPGIRRSWFNATPVQEEEGFYLDPVRMDGRCQTRNRRNELVGGWDVHWKFFIICKICCRPAGEEYLVPQEVISGSWNATKACDNVKNQVVVTPGLTYAWNFYEMFCWNYVKATPVMDLDRYRTQAALR